MTREIENHELADVAAVSDGNDYEVGNMISEALEKVGKTGVATIERGNHTENTLQIVEGMQFNRCYLSNYFVTDRRRMIVELLDCKRALKTEKEALTPVIRNKLKDVLQAAAIKAPAFGERKSHYLDDITILTGGTVIRDDTGMTLEKAGKEALGHATKVVITNNSTSIVTDASTQADVKKRVSQIRELVKVGAQTQVELKDKQLRMEDALNETKAFIGDGVVVGGGCCLLRLSLKVVRIKQHLDNEEQKEVCMFILWDFSSFLF